MQRSKGRAVLGFVLTGTLAASTAAFAGGGVPEGASGFIKPKLGSSYYAGPARVTDDMNRIVLDVPTGWYAIVPTEGVFGSTTLANYDMEHAVDWLPAHSAHVLLPRMAKFDLATFDLGSARSIDEWVAKRLSQGSEDGTQVAASQPIRYRMAGSKGLAYAVHLGLASSVEIALAWDHGKVLLATVYPVDSVDLNRALALVDTVRGIAGSGDRPSSETKAELDARLIAPIRSLIRRELRHAGSLEGLVPKAAPCTNWSGSDNAACGAGQSCPTSASITLNLPFQFQTWWMAGGVGSFFGNFYHGNCNKDYYAIDFNRYSSSSCASSLSPTGQNVYAAANGTATVGSDPGGYGNYVLVSHSNGYKSRYAHLQSVNVTNNQAVTTQTIVGFVGDTGSAAGAPHLHFGYQTTSGGVNVSYCNKSGGCPNGEGALSPQTQKPSPMKTNTGSLTMNDFGCYQAPP